GSHSCGASLLADRAVGRTYHDSIGYDAAQAAERGGIMKPRFVALMIVVVMGVASGVAAAQDLPRVKPEAVGLSSERLERITKWLGGEIEQNKLPGLRNMTYGAVLK